MSDEERFERHQQNYLHVTKHTAQTWAENFVTELNDTHIEADLRNSQEPPRAVVSHNNQILQLSLVRTTKLRQAKILTTRAVL